MAERDCTVEDFLEIYTEALEKHHSFGRLDPDFPNLFYEHSLATVWKIALDSISEEASILLSILSCLDPDGIPETMIREGAKASANMSFLASASSYTKATKELLRNGLIWKRNSQPRSMKMVTDAKPTRSVSLHRLVQETVFHQQSSEDRTNTFTKSVQVCLGVFPHPTRSNFRLMHRWAECELCLPHLLALNARYRDSRDIVPDCGLSELFLYAGWYLYERRAPEVALPLLTTARAVCERQDSGADWFLRSRILSAFGCVLFECSRYLESEKYFREALDIRLKNVSPTDILLAHGYQDTALALSGQGRFRDAIQLQKKALEIIAENDDEFTRRDMTFHVHHNMARTYEAFGDPAEALRLHFHQGDEFGNGLRKEMSESGAVNLYAIGNCHLALGNRDKGSEYHYRALLIRRKLVGENGFYYGISLHKMGTLLHASGDAAGALDAFQRVAEIFAGALDAQRELSRTKYHLSVVHRQLGNRAEADKEFEAAWNLRTGITGERRFTSVNEAEEMAGFDKLVIYIHA